MMTTSLLRRCLLLASATSLLAALPACTSNEAGVDMDPEQTGSDEPAPTILERVEGVIVDRAGLPLAGKLVIVAGQTVTTDGEGRFAFDSVIAPYDVMMTETGSSMVSAVTGLSTATPRIVYTYWPENRQATIAGTLQTPTKIGDHMMLGVTTPFGNETFDNMYAPSFNNSYARWVGPQKTSAHLIAIKYTEGADGRPVSFEALGTTTINVEAGTVTSGITLPSHDPVEATVSGQVSLPAGAEWSSVAAFTAAGGASAEVARFDDMTTFSAILPSGVGISAGFSAFAHTVDGDVVRFIRDVPTDVQGLQIEVPAPPHLVTPAAGSAITPGTVISWTDDTAKLFVVEVGQYDANQKRFPYYSRTLTSGHAVSVPDLAAMGLHWDASRWTYVWIYAYDLPWSLDDAAGQSLDTILENVWSSDGLTTVNGSLAFLRDGYAFPPAP